MIMNILATKKVKKNSCLICLHNFKVAKESFRLIRPNLREVRARTDPDLASLVILYLFEISEL